MSASKLEKWQSHFTGLSGSHDLQIKPLARSELLLSDLEADTSLNIELLDQAYLRLFLVRSKSNSSEQNISLNIKLAKDARAIVYDIDIAKAKTRAQIDITLGAHGAEFCYGGVHFLSDEAFGATDLLIKHEADNTRSTQAFRGLYKDKASGSFFGKVDINEAAANSSAEQLYRAILLSEDAKAFVKPQLEINNRHIKASHGASIGRLDEETLFYLRSRGFSKAFAESILVTSLAAEVLDTMGTDELSLAIASLVNDKIVESMVLSHA